MFRKREAIPEVVPTVVEFPEPAQDELLVPESGAELDSFPCPVCMGHGCFPFEPPQDPYSSTCPRCHGQGKVLTGSHVVAHTVRDCPDCTGRGYVEVRKAYEPLSVTRGVVGESPAS